MLLNIVDVILSIVRRKQCEACCKGNVSRSLKVSKYGGGNDYKLRVRLPGASFFCSMTENQCLKEIFDIQPLHLGAASVTVHLPHIHAPNHDPC